MVEKQNDDVMSLRAHHIICARFRISAQDSNRGPGFAEVKARMKARLARPDALIMVAEGIDILCQECPNLRDGRCIAAKGDETEVRKWDAILLRELGIPFGSCLTAGEWQAAINKKIPFKLCRRCQWNKVCTVGDLVI